MKICGNLALFRWGGAGDSEYPPSLGMMTSPRVKKDLKKPTTEKENVKNVKNIKNTKKPFLVVRLSHKLSKLT